MSLYIFINKKGSIKTPKKKLTKSTHYTTSSLKLHNFITISKYTSRKKPPRISLQIPGVKTKHMKTKYTVPMENSQYICDSNNIFNFMEMENDSLKRKKRVQSKS